MTVNSLRFLLFMLVTIIVYYAFPKKYRYTVLLAASYLFYATNGVGNLLYLGATTVSTYFAALLMDKIENGTKSLIASKADITKEEKKLLKVKTKHRKRLVLTAVLVLNIGILAVVKYSGFAVANLNGLLEAIGTGKLTIPKIAVPLGISYYTFISIGYSIDVCRAKYPAQKNFFKFALFTGFFAQITQGPINRYDVMAPQLFEGNDFNYHNLSYGCQRMLYGFAKKILIADHLSLSITQIYEDYSQYSGVAILINCVMYSIQIYCDFSGYVDIVNGLAEIFGINMPENFIRPYFSKSVDEYWRRWHATLGSWFKDYIFFPLSLSKASSNLSKFGKKKFGQRAARLLPLAFGAIVVWLVTGLWHGASWQFVVWGMLNCALILIGAILEPLNEKLFKKTKLSEQNFFVRAFRCIRTFFFITIIKQAVRAPSLSDAFAAYKKMIVGFGAGRTFECYFPTIDKKSFIIAIAFTALLFISELIQRKGSLRDMLAKKPYPVRWLIYIALIYCILIFGQFDNSMIGGFIYAKY